MRQWKLVMICLGMLLATTATAEQERIQHFSGIVLAVDEDGRLAVEEAGAEYARRSFEVSDMAALKKHDKKISIDDLEVGDPVTVEYKETPDGLKALSIQVLTDPTG